MEYLDIYLQKYIIDYLLPSENFLIKFVNKKFYILFNYFNIKNNYPTQKELYNIDILKWFIYNINFIPIKLQKDIMKILICKGENTQFYFCLNKNFECSEKCFYYALKFDNDEVLETFMDIKFKFNYKTIIYASKKGKYEVLKWLFKNIRLCKEKLEETDYLTELLPLAISSKNIDCVKFLMKNNCYINNSILALSIISGDLNIFTYILESVSNDLSVYFLPHKLLEKAITLSEIDFINIIYNKYKPQLKENLYDILLNNYEKNFKKEKTTECILWLLNKKCRYTINQKEILLKNNFSINKYV